MANAALKEALQSKGGADVYAPPVHLLVIAEEAPDHPNHHEHMARVDPSDPDNVALLASLREHGWLKSETASAWKDGKGDGARFVMSNGRRRIVCVKLENERRKREKDPRGPILPRIVLDGDPLLTETVANSMRKGDPPMVLARRFIQLRETMGAGKAAAALGLPLAQANDLAKIVANPDRDLHAAVNTGQIASDVAARAVNGGSVKVREVIAKATGADGKIDPVKAKAAALAAVPTKHRTRPHPKILANVEAALGLQHRTDADDAFRNGVLWALGVDVSGKVSPAVLAVLTDNGWGEGKAGK